MQEQRNVHQAIGPVKHYAPSDCINKAHGSNIGAHDSTNTTHGSINRAHGSINRALGSTNNAHGSTNNSHGSINVHGSTTLRPLLMVTPLMLLVS